MSYTEIINLRLLCQKQLDSHLGFYHKCKAILLSGYTIMLDITGSNLSADQGGGPRVVVSTAAFHARVRGSVPGLGGLKETKMFLPHPRVKVSIAGSLRDREVACSA